MAWTRAATIVFAELLLAGVFAARTAREIVPATLTHST